MTFSIVGMDPATKEIGVAVQSKIIAVGSVVPWAKAGIGAVATQSYANPAYGPDGLDLMEAGKTPQETINELKQTDSAYAYRQVGMIDANGNAAAYTGTRCEDWAGSRIGDNYTAQGNRLVGKDTINAMGESFENASGTLAERLLASLKAGQDAGGDRRGQQSAAINVVLEHGGYLGANDHYIDLRVDEHPEPITELQRIYQLHQLHFGVTRPEDVLPLEGQVYADVFSNLKRLGYIHFPEPSADDLMNALTSFIHQENIENRELKNAQIDVNVLNFLRDKPSA